MDLLCRSLISRHDQQLVNIDVSWASDNPCHCVSNILCCQRFHSSVDIICCFLVATKANGRKLRVRHTRIHFTHTHWLPQQFESQNSSHCSDTMLGGVISCSATVGLSCCDGTNRNYLPVSRFHQRWQQSFRYPQSSKNIGVKHPLPIIHVGISDCLRPYGTACVVDQHVTATEFLEHSMCEMFH